MIQNIYYIAGTIILVINCLLIINAKTALRSIEWLVSYKLANKTPDKKRINYKLVGLWLTFSVGSTLWLLLGIFVHYSILFASLSVVNLGTNYMLSKHRGQAKVKLAFAKTLILNLILLSLILTYWF